MQKLSIRILISLTFLFLGIILGNLLWNYQWKLMAQYLQPPFQPPPPPSQCIKDTLKYKKALEDFLKAFANQKNDEILSLIKNNLNTASLTEFILNGVNGKNFSSENEFQGTILRLVTSGLNLGFLKANGSIVCNVQADGNGPFCEGPIGSGESSELKSIKLSIEVPFNGKIKINGKDKEFSGRIKLKSLEIWKQTGAQGVDGVWNDRLKKWRKYGAILNFLGINKAKLDNGSIEVRLGTGEIFQSSLGSSIPVFISLNITCRF